MELDNKLVLTILGDENKGTLTSILRDLGYIIGKSVIHCIISEVIH